MSTSTETPKQTLQVNRIPFDQVPQLSARDKAYANGDPALRPFYKYEVNIKNFSNVIAAKQKANINRLTLVNVLEQQYQKFDTTQDVLNNVTSLKDDTTFTIITAHQPSLFTGPLYYIYKIVSVINLTKRLKAEYPAYNFVPVFVTGGEDHDFEEVNHMHLFGKTLTWENEEKGSVGMMKTASLAPVLEELKSFMGDKENDQRLFELIHSTHTQHEKYSDAIMAFANELFKEYGLVILNMNQPDLKRLFLPIIKEELLKNPSKDLVEKSQDDLKNAGFKSQAYPREINLFYLKDQLRERIIKENGVFKVLNTDYTFSETEMIAEAENHPERFSPNVITRPLYQEKVIPNLAYIGGGGELAYWMERQSQFAHYGIEFPMLIRRNSVMWIDKGTSKKMTKLNLTIDNVFDDSDSLIKLFIQDQTEGDLSFEQEKNQLRTMFDSMKEKASQIDPTLVKKFEGEYTRQLKSLEQMESRLVRAEKQKNEVSVNQIRALKEKLYPKNGLQERYDNFISFYLKYGDRFIETLMKHLNPLEKGFIVIKEE